MTNKPRGFQPGRTKTGGRKPNPLGPPRRLFITVPHEIKLPENGDEARAVILTALREFLKAQNSKQ